MSGGLAGATSLLFVYPLDLATTLLSADVGTNPKFSGIFNCLGEAISCTGITGLYSGFDVSILGIVLYRATYFGLYDSLRPIVPKNFFARFLFAQLTTIAAGLLTYPLDTIRRRMMVQATKKLGEIQYTSSFDCLKKILTNEGVCGLFDGALINIGRAIIGSLALVAVDIIVESWRENRRNQQQQQHQQQG